MPTMMENVKTVNSSARTVLLAGVLGVLGWGGYVGYNSYIKPGLEANQAMEKLANVEKQLAEKDAALVETKQNLVAAAEKNEKLNDENEKLNTSLKLLKIDRRMGNIEVLEKSQNEKGEPTLLVRFTEIDELGDPVGSSRDFTLRGDKLYIDCWIVQFKDKYVEQQDLLRSASLCVFKSIFGEIDGPTGAFALDNQTEQRPGIYGDDDQRNKFEEKIWSDFWAVSNDPSLQDDLGIRASHGQANYVKAQEGKVYQVKIRASGAASLEPIDVQSN